MISGRRRAALLVSAVVLLVLIGGRTTAGFFADLLWFRSLGAEDLFWTRWKASAVSRLLLVSLFAAFLFANLSAVTRTLGVIRVRRRYANLEIAERLPRGYVLTVILLVSLLSGWWLSAGLWDPVALLAALRHGSWGTADPIFGRDLSYYAFVFPMLARLQARIGLLLAWTALVVVSTYLVTGAIKADNNRVDVSPFARRHLGVLAALFLLVTAWDLWLDRYGLLYAGNGVAGSIGYTDVHARLPAMLAAVLACVAAAGAVGYALWIGRGRRAAAVVALLVTSGLAALIGYPALLQKLVVEPNEAVRERPFIEQHIRFTRLGYGLDGVETVRLPYRDPGELTASRLSAALSQVPLWDPRPLLETIGRTESHVQYYGFRSVHLDRYGDAQVAIAVRELNPAGLPEPARTWQNLHLRYVSGDGAVVAAVSRMSSDATPVYFLRDRNPPKLAADAPPELQLREPRIFFGEGIGGYVVVDTASTIGVELNSLWRKVVFAWTFQSRNLLLSSAVTPESRIVFRRGLADRVRRLAPFLTVLDEEGVLPVIHQGRVVWIVDGFTTTPFLPLSQPGRLGGAPLRYVRNSIKATVDAVTGEVVLYATDTADPLLRTYAALFPGLVRPIAEMPDGLRSHLKYSAPLLGLEAETLGNYHLEDPARFYAREDVWTVATQKYRDDEERMQPTYASFQLPNGSRPEFALTLPLVALGRPNLAGLLVARNDGDSYGQRVLYEMPRDELVPGPQQIEAQIDQDPEISQQLSLWKEGGSQVLRGHLLAVPVDNTLVYLEPLFLEAESGAIPQLERVILATARGAVMGPTLEAAIAALLGSEPAAGEDASEPEAAPSARGGAPGAGAMAEARRLMDRAEQQLRAGDWAGFGQSWGALRELLRQQGGSGGW